jgi:CubicO group peptidase (beta-lactamase class C family)
MITLINKRRLVSALAALFLAVGLPGKAAAEVQARFGLTPAQFKSTEGDFFKQGYQLKTVSGYVSGGSERYAALWVKGGPLGPVDFGIPAADFQNRFNNFFKQGYRLTWVSAHEAGGQLFYETTWEKTGGPEWQAKVGMSSADYQTAFNNFQKQGYRLVHVYGYSSNGSATYAAIWEKSSGPDYQARNGISSTEFQNLYNQFLTQGYVLKVVSGFNTGGSDQYAAIWEKITSPVWDARFGSPESTYQGVFDNYFYQGYLPAYLTAFTSSGSSARLNTIWTNTNFSGTDLGIIRDKVGAALQAANIAGLSIAVAKDGRLVYAAGFGMADKENGVEMSVDHRLRIGSISKTVTAVSIFRLIEAKTPYGMNGQTLALNSQVFGAGGVLGNKIALPGLMSKTQSSVTIQDLLEMVSGIPDTPDPLNCAAGDLNNRISYQLAQVTALPANPPQGVGPVPRAPGSEFEYSNLGFIILQSVIETVSGQTYQDYVLSHVFSASHITTPRLFTIGPYDPASGEAKHYLTNGAYAEYAPDQTCDNLPPGVGSGGWAMTPKDLLRHLVSVDGLPGEILTQADHITMTTGSPIWPSYGKGWLLVNWGSCNSGWSISQGHNGGLQGAFSDLFLLPNGLSFVLNSNQDATAAGFCTPVATAGTPAPAKVTCCTAGAACPTSAPVCADEPLARMIEILGKVTWPSYDLF